MKILFTLFSFVLFTCFSAVAQQKLSNSKTSGSYTYIYRLTDKEMLAIATKGKEVINDTYLHTLIDSFKVATKYVDKLPFGNYLYATPVKNRWQYNLNDKRNVEIAFVNNKKHFQFYVKDLKGNLIKNAEVFVGKGEKARYEEQTGLYKSGYQKKNQVIQVKYESVNNFFSFEIKEQYKYNYKAIKKRVKKPSKPKPKTNIYRGYMVFSKPKYKPLDTVKFKAYIIDNKTGKEIKPEDVDVFLYTNYRDKKKIANIKPYRNGAYEYSFVLVDSLNIKLDKYYTVALIKRSKDKEEQLFSGSFRYEEYELKSIDFKIRASKTIYKKSDSVIVFMKVTDENELAVPDGRVKLSVHTSQITKYSKNAVFVPDTLWTKEMDLEPVGETKLVIPAHIFPDANIRFNVRANFLNSNNESRRASVSVTREEDNEELFIVKLEKDSLFFSLANGNKPIDRPILLKSYSFNDELLDSVVLNSSKIKADYRAEYYDIILNEKTQTYFLTDNKPDLSVSALHNKDSVRVKINNENKLPFWYTMFSGNSIISKGYTTELDTSFRHNSSKAVHISVNYFWDNKEKSVQASTFYNPNELNVKLIAPDVVYPGQKVNMLVKVLDTEGEPVSNVDVTTYAHTSKFGVIKQPSLPRFKGYYSRKLSGTAEADDVSASGNFKLSWLKWSKALGLDTVEYYKFANHKGLYAITEDAKNNITQFVPFVINNGDIDPVNIVYVDDIPVFFNKVDQLTSYAFEIKPGKHEIALRTATKKVVLKEIDIVAGKRNIFSVSSALDNPKAIITNEKSELSDIEARQLDRYLIKIANLRQPYNKQLIKFDTTTVLLNTPNNNVGSEFLVGPFNENILTYQTEEFSHNFIRESGYVYTFLPNLLKQKSFRTPYAFDINLSSVPKLGNDNYLQQVIKKAEIDSIWNDYFDLRSRTTALFINEAVRGISRGKLIFKLADSLIKEPYLKNIVVYQPERPSFMHIYQGNMQRQIFLEEGTYKMMFLLKNNSYYLIEDVKVKRNGVNYYEWKELKSQKADQKSLELDKYIKSLKRGGNKIDTRILEAMNDNEQEDFTIYKNPVKGRVLSKRDKQPLIGAMVKIVGLKRAVITNRDGYFTIDAPKRGKISIILLGYKSVETELKQGNLEDIYLEEDSKSLEEVVIVGYGTVAKKDLTGSVAKVVGQDVLAGRLAGISVTPTGEGPDVRIRGFSSVTNDNKPLYIIDGLPYDGDLNSINPNDIENIEILKDASATALYGSRAANGVIIVKTKKGNSLITEAGELVAQQQTMRTNFSDEGFWQPKLNTDKDGNAIFTVKFPDDITSWNASVIAMNGKKQSGTAMAKIKSFKSLSANLAAPQFAVEGDSINIIGKLMNYSPNEEKMQRKMLYNNSPFLNSNVAVKNSLIDTIPIKVLKQDSLSFEYTLTQDNGYFDGEIRKIPVFAKGVKETKGYFAALNTDTTINYSFDKTLGKVSVRAEASVFPVLLDEMKQLYRYEYLCNEQMASKLKSLLLEKQLKSYLQQNFEHEKDLKNLIKKLNGTKKSQGTWGWWQDSDEEIWISLHVVEALLLAEKNGYKIDLNKDKLYDYLRRQLVVQQDYSKLKLVELLYLLNDKNQIKDWLKAIESGSASYQPTSYEKFKLLYLKQLSGTKVNIDSLLKTKKQTMFGNSYWGENKIHFWNSNIQNTLLAYKIIKESGNYKQEQNQIINYFLEQRKDGKWQNTYESSLILEAILPHLLKNNPNKEAPEIVLNGSVIKDFPYQQEFESSEKLELKKKGSLPVYFTAYQQFQNSNPKKIDKDFIVRTTLLQNEKAVTSLKAGQVATLKIDVEVRADADYVMIEVPIPAGCSYDSKSRGYWGIETHREYFKEKISIFCTKLKQGKYTFDISLMPRYNGQYILNPAKAEMMYFPVFFGRDDLKRVEIK